VLKNFDKSNTHLSATHGSASMLVPSRSRGGEMKKVSSGLREFGRCSAWRTAVVVKVESYRLTFTNNQRYSVARARDSTCRPAERYEALKGVPLVSMAWFRVPLLCRTVRERLGHASVNPLTVAEEPTMWTKARVPGPTGKPERSSRFANASS